MHSDLGLFLRLRSTCRFDFAIRRITDQMTTLIHATMVNITHPISTHKNESPIRRSGQRRPISRYETEHLSFPLLSSSPLNGRHNEGIRSLTSVDSIAMPSWSYCIFRQHSKSLTSSLAEPFLRRNRRLTLSTQRDTFQVLMRRPHRPRSLDPRPSSLTTSFLGLPG